MVLCCLYSTLSPSLNPYHTPFDDEDVGNYHDLSPFPPLQTTPAQQCHVHHRLHLSTSTYSCTTRHTTVTDKQHTPLRYQGLVAMTHTKS